MRVIECERRFSGSIREPNDCTNCIMGDTVLIENASPLVNGGKMDAGEMSLQALEEKARKAQEAFEKEEKLRKELEDMNTKLLTEKTNLLRQLEGEKGSLSEYQEKSLKLAAQKADLDSQLQVSEASPFALISFCFFFLFLTIS